MDDYQIEWTSSVTSRALPQRKTRVMTLTVDESADGVTATLVRTGERTVDSNERHVSTKRFKNIEAVGRWFAGEVL